MGTLGSETGFVVEEGVFQNADLKKGGKSDMGDIEDGDGRYEIQRNMADIEDVEYKGNRDYKEIRGDSFSKI